MKVKATLQAVDLVIARLKPDEIRRVVREAQAAAGDDTDPVTAAVDAVLKHLADEVAPKLTTVRRELHGAYRKERLGS